MVATMEINKILSFLMLSQLFFVTLMVSNALLSGRFLIFGVLLLMLTPVATALHFKGQLNKQKRENKYKTNTIEWQEKQFVKQGKHIAKQEEKIEKLKTKNMFLLTILNKENRDAYNKIGTTKVK
jgi:hypothetical protein